MNRLVDLELKRVLNGREIILGDRVLRVGVRGRRNGGFYLGNIRCVFSEEEVGLESIVLVVEVLMLFCLLHHRFMSCVKWSIINSCMLPRFVR